MKCNHCIVAATQGWLAGWHSGSVRRHAGLPAALAAHRSRVRRQNPAKRASVLFVQMLSLHLFHHQRHTSTTVSAGWVGGRCALPKRSRCPVGVLKRENRLVFPAVHRVRNRKSSGDNGQSVDMRTQLLHVPSTVGLMRTVAETVLPHGRKRVCRCAEASCTPVHVRVPNAAAGLLLVKPNHLKYW
jgi:hypothetical protein